MTPERARELVNRARRWAYADPDLPPVGLSLVLELADALQAMTETQHGARQRSGKVEL